MPDQPDSNSDFWADSRLAAVLDREEGVQTQADTSANDDATRTGVTDDATGKDKASPEPTDQTDSSSSTPDASKKTDKPAPKPDAKPPDNQSRFAKEVERRDKSWKALNAEKEAMKAQLDQYTRDRQTFDQAKQAWEQERAAQEVQFSPEQYDKAAEKFDAIGKPDLADEARAAAAHLRNNPPAIQKIEQARQYRFKQAEAQSYGKAVAKYPNVFKPGTPENTEGLAIIKANPDLWQSLPQASEIVAEMVTHKLQANRVPELEKEREQLRSRIKTLEALTNPEDGGHAPELPGSKNFDQMSVTEQEAALKADLTSNPQRMF